MGVKFRVVWHRIAKNNRAYRKVLPMVFDCFEDAVEFAERRVIGAYNVQAFYEED